MIEDTAVEKVLKALSLPPRNQLVNKQLEITFLSGKAEPYIDDDERDVEEQPSPEAFLHDYLGTELGVIIQNYKIRNDFGGGIWVILYTNWTGRQFGEIIEISFVAAVNDDGDVDFKVKPHARMYVEIEYVERRCTGRFFKSVERIRWKKPRVIDFEVFLQA